MDRNTKILGIALIAVIAAGVLFIWIQNWRHEKQVAELQERLAKTAETVKIDDGQYQKILQIQKNLEAAIDTTTQQGKELEKRLDRVDAKLLSVTNAQVSMKDSILKLEKIVNKPGPVDRPGSWQIPINKTSGLMEVNGFCVTGPTSGDNSSCELKLHMIPWTLTQVINQQQDGTWVVDAAVPSEISLNFGRVSVNPRILKPRFYERLNLGLLLAANSSEGLGGASVGYRFTSFNLSALVLTSTAGNNHVYYGGQVLWFPWEK